MSHTDIIPYFFEMNMLILFISKALPKIMLGIRRFELLATMSEICALSTELYPFDSIFCGWRDLNPHAVLAAGDFKSPVSTIPPQPQSRYT